VGVDWPFPFLFSLVVRPLRQRRSHISLSLVSDVFPLDQDILRLVEDATHITPLPLDIKRAHALHARKSLHSTTLEVFPAPEVLAAVKSVGITSLGGEE